MMADVVMPEYVGNAPLPIRIGTVQAGPRRVPFNVAGRRPGELYASPARGKPYYQWYPYSGPDDDFFTGLTWFD